MHLKFLVDLRGDLISLQSHNMYRMYAWVAVQPPQCSAKINQPDSVNNNVKCMGEIMTYTKSRFFKFICNDNIFSCHTPRFRGWLVVVNNTNITRLVPDKTQAGRLKPSQGTFLP